MSRDRAIWDEFHADWETAAYESETLYRQRAAERQLAESNRDRVPPPPIRNQQSAIPNLPSEEDIAFRSHQPTDEERSIRVRTAQDFFRRAVLASYRATCCISGIALPELLVASHILPWSATDVQAPLSPVPRGEGPGVRGRASQCTHLAPRDEAAAQPPRSHRVDPQWPAASPAEALSPSPRYPGERAGVRGPTAG